MSRVATGGAARPDDRPRTVLRDAGQRVTVPRLAVLETLYADAGHLTADEVHAQVLPRHPDVALSTVYRTLESLTRLDVVQHVHVADGAVRYHLADRLTGHAHAHTQCSSCGRLEDLPLDVLADVTRRLVDTQGFHLDAGHVALSGLCADCAPVREHV